MEQFLSQYNMTPLSFFEEAQRTHALIAQHSPTSFTHHQRLSPRLGTRILAVSGLSWNAKSQNKKRDYTNIAVAVTLECINLASYRKELTKDCTSANNMRQELYEYFFSIARPHHEAFAGNGVQPRNFRPKLIKEWEFADLVPIVQDSDGMVVDAGHDPINLKETLDNARTKMERLKKDPRTRFVNNIVNNTLLHCSNPSLPKGTLETSVYHHIQAIVDVRPSLTIAR
jgi:hypothetical protein